MKRIWIIVAVSILLLLLVFASSCSQNDCSYLKRVTGNTQCLEANTTIKKTKKKFAAVCAGAANSRKISINCSPATASVCDSSSNGASFYAVLMPDDGTNTFNDTTAGTYTTCSGLWNAISSGVQFSDITAIYFSDPDLGESVTCTDSGGCTFTSSYCFSGWNSSSYSPTGTAASLTSGQSLLACVYIDSTAVSGGGGGTPVYGTPATASASSFDQTTVASPISFSTWVDY